jgi:hypothetical protein
VLPVLPILIVAGLVTCQAFVRLAASHVAPRLAGPMRWLGSLIVGAAAASSLIAHPLFDAHRAVRSTERVYSEVIRWMKLRGDVPQPIVLSQLGGATLYYAPDLHQLRLDRISAGTWRQMRAWQARTNLPIDAALFVFEHDELFVLGRDRLPCAWQPRDVFHSITFWRCPPPVPAGAN